METENEVMRAFLGASLRGCEGGRVRRLHGFVKGAHFEPEAHSPNAEAFVRRAGSAEVEARAEELFARIRRGFGYKRRALVYSCEGGSAAIKGPDFEVRRAAPGDTAEAAADILLQWLKAGLCTPKDICILGRRSRLEISSLGGLTELAGHPLADYPVPGPDTGPTAAERLPHDTLRYLSLNRAKGLDFLAVLLIDTPRPTHPDEFLLAATRARQMLGVVEAPSLERDENQR